MDFSRDRSETLSKTLLELGLVSLKLFQTFGLAGNTRRARLLPRLLVEWWKATLGYSVGRSIVISASAAC